MDKEKTSSTGKETMKSTNINIRIEQDLKDAFYQKCKEKAINPSAFLRKKIIDFLDEMY